MEAQISHNEKIYYEIHGNENAKDTVIFFNGIISALELWQPYMDKILEECDVRILFHNYRGQEKSSLSSDEFKYEHHLTDLISLLDYLKIEDNIHLVAVSYGAPIAMMYAINYPEKVKSMITISAFTDLLNEDRDKAKDISSWANTVIKSIQKHHDEKSIKLLKKRFFAQFFSLLYTQEFMRTFKEIFYEKIEEFINTYTDDFYNAFVHLESAFVDIDIFNNVHKVKCPTYIIHGTKDRLISHDYSEHLAKKIPNSQFKEIANQGHALFIEKRVELSDEVSVFLKQFTR